MGSPEQKFNPEKREGEFRSLTVKSVRETEPVGDSLLIDFKDSIVSFELKKDFLSQHGLENIAIGDKIEVKGKKGNEDADLWGLSKIEDIRKTE